MRRRARIDANHNAIVSALRKAGASVLSLATLGNGAPDLLAGRAGQMWLIECKDGARPPSERMLTTDQRKWMDAWRGTPVVIAYGPDDALRAIGAIA